MFRFDEGVMKASSFALAGAAGVAIAPGALAADMRVKSPVIPPAAASWTGWYVGGNVGVAWQQINQTLDAHDYGTKFSTFIGGGQIGYNWQKGNLVLGLEGDISGLSSKLENRTDDYFRSYGGNISWLSTVRARLGLAVNDTMVYLTGGVAFGEVKWELNEQNGDRYDFKKTKTGWVVGVGAEHMWNSRLTFALEGLFVDLGHAFQHDDSLPNGLPNGFDERFVGAQTFIGRFKVNYKLN